jgi:hypothetical protein
MLWSVAVMAILQGVNWLMPPDEKEQLDPISS